MSDTWGMLGSERNTAGCGMCVTMFLKVGPAHIRFSSLEIRAVVTLFEEGGEEMFKLQGQFLR